MSFSYFGPFWGLGHDKFPLGFPLLLPLYLYILERFLTQTLTTPNLSVESSFGAFRKHWNEPFSGRCNWAKLQNPES